MSLPLNREMLEGAYRYLAATQPFLRWNLPDADDIVFLVTHSKKTAGAHRWNGSCHEVALSAKCHAQSLTVLKTMAHEMIHLHMEANKVKERAEHGPVFERYASQVCDYHGWDVGEF